MSTKPIFVATHPRACSTAFERVFMTRRDVLQCVHEPFGDAFYYGPERLSERFENDEQGREDSGFAQSTYKTILERLERESAEGKRLFIKDIAHYLAPPHGDQASIAPSLAPPTVSSTKKKGVGTRPYPYDTESEPSNPTVIPTDTLGKFHFTFLIRHPRSSIPSYYRCTIPPLDALTGFPNFMPSEAGYDELRRIFDYLRSSGIVGPEIAGRATDGNAVNGVNGVNGTNGVNGHGEKVSVCVVDADDLLDNPAGIIQAYCKEVGLDYSPEMLRWDNPEDQDHVQRAFAKWKGFHEDAINSTELTPRLHKKKPKENKDEDAEWTAKFGAEGAKIIRDTVEKNIPDYEYLKQFAIKA
ncbi:MAG: hypothetical protein M4579_001665 [Chaenotheca gracillima]|nr:MAG: hypothetical protein M4579_001665 [Chaenotheca gracillima]